jgi:hypothetical protein
MTDTMLEPKTRRRPGLVVTGIVILALGAAGAVALWFAADKRFDDAIEKLAPAPVGCDTTLEFDKAGTFFIFAETKGEVGEVDGDCENDEQSYNGENTDLDLVMFDRDQAEMDLDRDRSVDYDNGTSKGVSLYTVEIPEGGEYVLRVEGPDPEVVARVGSDPNESVSTLQTGAIVCAIAGLVIGLLLIALGLRRRREPATSSDVGGDVWSPQQPPGFGPPTSPPTGPPTSPYPPAVGPTAPDGEAGQSPMPPPTWGPPS